MLLHYNWIEKSIAASIEQSTNSIAMSLSCRWYWRTLKSLLCRFISLSPLFATYESVDALLEQLLVFFESKMMSHIPGTSGKRDTKWCGASDGSGPALAKDVGNLPMMMFKLCRRLMRTAWLVVTWNNDVGGRTVCSADDTVSTSSLFCMPTRVEHYASIRAEKRCRGPRLVRRFAQIAARRKWRLPFWSESYSRKILRVPASRFQWPFHLTILVWGYYR